MSGKPRNLKEQAAEARRAALLRHAQQELVDKGYAHASLNQVSRLSGGSKATIVKYYGNKAGLFSAILIQGAADFCAELELESCTDRDADLATTIDRLARRLLEFYLTPEAIALYRGVVGSGHSDPVLSESFYTGGHRVIVGALARILSRWVGNGIATSCDLDACADRFTHLVRAGLYERYLLGLARSAPSAEELEQAALEAARFFARALRPD